MAPGKNVHLKSDIGQKFRRHPLADNVEEIRVIIELDHTAGVE